MNANEARKEKRSHLWERDPRDWYVEPRRATEALLSVEKFVGQIYDPAAGSGNIVETCIHAGYDAIGSDIVRRTDKPWFTGEIDWLVVQTVPAPVNVITNPPFYRAKGAEAFIRKALAYSTGKVCAFVDIRFIADSDRANNLFLEFAPHRIWIITPRVSCPPGPYLAAGGKAGNGSSDWCWLVWDMTAPPGETRIGWLRAKGEGRK